MMPITQRLKQCQIEMATLIRQSLPPLDPTTPLFAAMHHACLNGGKRLRPLLVYTTAELFSVAKAQLNPLAVAIELIHCYSLIHDDLPAMDNDDLRRGQPTCHKLFGEATAILAGNALLTLAFEILAAQQNSAMALLSKAAGCQGMILGQALDLSPSLSPTQSTLIKMHQAKTGALIAASVQCGALLATPDQMTSLAEFGQAIGLAFQIQDDILDATGHTQKMGKHPQKDVKENKATFVTLLGLEKANSQMQHYYQKALSHLTPFGEKATPLRELARYMIKRDN